MLGAGILAGGTERDDGLVEAPQRCTQATVLETQLTNDKCLRSTARKSSELSAGMVTQRTGVAWFVCSAGAPTHRSWCAGL